MMHSCVTFVLLCCVVLTAFILDLKFILKMALETKECGKEKTLLSSLLARGRKPARPSHSLRPSTFPSPLHKPSVAQSLDPVK
jgi:hypothetical protein